MNAGPFDPRTQRLFGFIAAAVGIHLLLAIKLPPAVPRAAPDRVLSVILEKEPVVTNPRKPEPSPSRGPMTSGDSDTDYTANDERTPPGVTTTTEPAGSPSVHELLQPVPEVSREKHKPFSLKPDTHLIFEPERTVRPPSGRR